MRGEEGNEISKKRDGFIRIFMTSLSVSPKTMHEKVIFSVTEGFKGRFHEMSLKILNILYFI